MDFKDYKISPKKKAPNSYLASIVLQVNEHCYGKEGIKDPDCWKMWLGIGKRISPGILKDKLEYMKSRNIKSPRYLLAMCRSK